jgi:hypothetical protein
MACALLGSSYWFTGQPAEGLALHEQSLILDSDNPILHWTTGYTYALLNRVTDAQVHARWMQARLPEMPYTLQLVSLLDAMEGRRAEALATLGTIAEMKFDAHITFHLSESYAMAGDPENALRVLEYAVTRGFYPSDYISVHCPFLQSLRGTAEFDRIAAIAARRAAEFRA